MHANMLLGKAGSLGLFVASVIIKPVIEITRRELGDKKEEKLFAAIRSHIIPTLS